MTLPVLVSKLYNNNENIYLFLFLCSRQKGLRRSSDIYNLQLVPVLGISFGTSYSYLNVTTAIIIITVITYIKKFARKAS